MPDLLQHIFAGVCGQNSAHTWTPGGLALPCCQRCTGLYTGAFVAALLQIWLKPRQTSRFLWIHGAFLLVMIPFGFHWLPQEGTIRTLTGSLFGFGLVSFLWLMPTALLRGAPTSESKETASKYFAAVALWVVLVQLLSRANSQAAACLLALICAGGLLALAALALVNVWLLASSVMRSSPASPP